MLSSDRYIHFFSLLFFFSPEADNHIISLDTYIKSIPSNINRKTFDLRSVFTFQLRFFILFYFFDFSFSFKQVYSLRSCKKFESCFETKISTVSTGASSSGGSRERVDQYRLCLWDRSWSICSTRAESEKGNNSAAITTRLDWRQSYSVGSEGKKK